MKPNRQARTAIILTGIICGLLLFTTFFTGCTSSHLYRRQHPRYQHYQSPQHRHPPHKQYLKTVSTTAGPGAAVATTSTPAPVYTYSEGNVVVYTAASLKGVSPKLAEGFAKMYPGHTVVFNLDGTQALNTQVQNGAYADVFISASNSYTNEPKKGGYFNDATVSTLTTNYVIVILPVNNPVNIRSLADLAKPGAEDRPCSKDSPGRGLQRMQHWSTLPNPRTALTGTPPSLPTRSRTRFRTGSCHQSSAGRG